jgi:hypothetical protein
MLRPLHAKLGAGQSPQLLINEGDQRIDATGFPIAGFT